MYCGVTVRPSEKLSEGANIKPGSKSWFFGSQPYFYFRFRLYGYRDGRFCRTVGQNLLCWASCLNGDLVRSAPGSPGGVTELNRQTDLIWRRDPSLRLLAMDHVTASHATGSRTRAFSRLLALVVLASVLRIIAVLFSFAVIILHSIVYFMAKATALS